jgi:hypothetical protein
MKNKPDKTKFVAFVDESLATKIKVLSVMHGKSIGDYLTPILEKHVEEKSDQLGNMPILSQP